MLGFMTRLWRVLWRQDSEGSGGAVVLAFPQATVAAEAPAAHVAFIQMSAEPCVQPVVQEPARRHLAAQLQSVSRLNPPSSRAVAKPLVAPAGKPRPVAAATPLKRSSRVKPGAVLSRIAAADRQRGANVIDLQKFRRERQNAATDREIAALFL